MKLQKMQNRKDIGSGEIFICVLVLFLCIIFSFVLEYGFLVEKTELFKEDLRTAMEDYITKQAKESIYELRRTGLLTGAVEEIRTELAGYKIENLLIEKIEGKNGGGIRVEGILLIDFIFCGKVAFVAQIPFSEQKIYENPEVVEW